MNTKPNVILIGAQKCGTTSIYDWLSQHPEVYGHKGMKDYNFFGKDELYYKFGTEWFSKQFKNENNKVVLHGSVIYIHSSKVAERIYSFNPTTKLILILRNPIDRAYSSYNDLRKTGRNKSSSFEDALDFSQKLIVENKEQDEDFYSENILSHGLYYRQIKNYLNFFNKDQIKIILFDELKESPKNVMNSLFDFISVKRMPEMNLNSKNESGAPRSKLLQLFFQRLRIPTFVKRYLPVASLSQLKFFLIRTLNNKKVAYPKMKEDTRLFLIDYYNKDISLVEELLDLNLESWKK